MIIFNERELQLMALNHSSDIIHHSSEFKDFMKLYKDDTKEPLSLLVNNTTALPSDNPLRLSKNLL